MRTLTHSSMWLRSSLLYTRSSLTSCWLLFSMFGSGALPDVTGIDLVGGQRSFAC